MNSNICPDCGNRRGWIFCCRHRDPGTEALRAVERACVATIIRATTDGYAKPVLRNVSTITGDIVDLVQGGASLELVARRYSEWRQWLADQTTGLVLRTERELEPLTELFASLDPEFNPEKEEQLIERLRCDLIASGAVREV